MLLFSVIVNPKTKSFALAVTICCAFCIVLQLLQYNCLMYQVLWVSLMEIYITLPIIDYADIVYQNISDSYLRPLNVVFLLRCPYRSLSLEGYFTEFSSIFKCVYFNYPSYLRQFLVPCRSS